MIPKPAFSGRGAKNGFGGNLYFLYREPKIYKFSSSPILAPLRAHNTHEATTFGIKDSSVDLASLDPSGGVHRAVRSPGVERNNGGIFDSESEGPSIRLGLGST